MTAIQWTDETWNPVTGCSRVSEGCRHCYIERTPPFRMNGRKLGDPVQLHPDRLAQPLRWTKPRRVFVNSLSDLFHEDVSNEYIVAVFGVMAVRPDHTFQILTKRPQRMREWFQWLNERGGLGRFIRSIRVDGDRTIPNFFNSVMRTAVYRGQTHRAIGDPWGSVFNAASFHMVDSPLKNIWLGVSVEDQKTADERIPILLQTPTAVRFVSYEPALGPVDLKTYLQLPTAFDEMMEPRQAWNVLLNWVIAGGESGPGARPCDVAHLRSIVEQCKGSGVPVFVKQLGANVVDRNDAGFEGDTDESWPMDTRFEQEYAERNYQGTLGRVRLKDHKGGDPAEWPADLRVREWPR